MIELNRYYHDRGIQKYNGFYLSEHTGRLVEESQQAYDNCLGKESMSEDDIYSCLDEALYYDRVVAIQLNVADVEGQFMPDVVGKILGYNEDCLYINEIPIKLSQIRHISLTHLTKWYED